MHENVKPTLHDGIYICSWKCDHWSEKRYVPCDIIERISECCVPWYQNRAEELEGQVERALWILEDDTPPDSWERTKNYIIDGEEGE